MMHPPVRHSIPAPSALRVTAVLVAINLFVIGLAAYFLQQSRAQYEAQARVTTQNLAQVLERSLAVMLDRIDLGLLAVVDEFDRQQRAGGVQAAAFDEALARQRDRLVGVSRLRATDADGRVRFGLDGETPPGLAVTHRDFFARLRDDPAAGLVVSRPSVGQHSGRPVIFLARRLTATDGTFAGVVFALIYLDYVETLFSTLDVGPHGSVTVRDLDLAIVAHQPHRGPGDVVGHAEVSQEFRSLFERSPAAGTYSTTAPMDSIHRTYSYRRIGDRPLIVATALASRDYLAPWWASVLQYTVIAAVFALLSGLLSSVVHRTWKALYASEGRYRSTFEHASVGIVELQADGSVLKCNRQMADMLGRAPADIDGRDFVELLPADERGAHRARFARLWTEPPWRQEWECRLVGTDGETRWAQVSASLVRGADETPLHGVAILRDVTHRKEIEQWQAHFTRLLDELSAGAPLGRLLTEIATFVEQACDGAMCAVMLVGDDRRQLVVGAAPNLPKVLRDAIDGLAIDPACGSCGLAASRGEAVIADDLATHPAWEGRRELVRIAGIHACWSAPILASDGTVLGTLAQYYASPRSASRKELALIERAARQAALVIERAQQQEDLRLASQAFATCSEAMVITNARSEILSVNQAFVAMSGYAPAEVLGKNPRILQSGRQEHAYYVSMWDALLAKGRWQGELWNRHKNGSEYPVLGSISRVTGADGRPTHYIGIFQEISELKSATERIRRMAYYDALTGLPNRVLLQDRVDRALGAALRHGGEIALLFLDLDRFKFVNDSLGHSAGDLLLKEVGRRLAFAVGEPHTVARLGGDEFVVVLENAGRDEAARVARDIMDRFTEPLELAGQLLPIETSIGICLYPRDAQDLETLLQYADAALYKAKDGGRNQFRFFEPEMNAEVVERLGLETDLRQALGRGELSLHYQPQVSLATHRLIGFEALLRWHHPVRGHVSPARFIPVAEGSGLIVEIGKWVLDEACRQMRAWRDAGLADVPVAVNLSTAQLRDEGLAEALRETLARHGLPGSTLELEVTESLLLEVTGANLRRIEALKALAVSLSVDDFGTGYSSLAYLKQFPIDKLKIDASFVRDLAEDRDDLAIADAIVGLGHSLGLQVVAEGVETGAQAELLAGLGCDFAQGYLFGRPLPAGDVERWVEANARSEADAPATLQRA